MDPSTKKLLALTLAVTVLAGSAVTMSTLQDADRSTATLKVGNVPGGPGETSSSDVVVGVGNTESGSCTGNTEGCTTSISVTNVDIPDAAEPRYARGVIAGL